MTQPRTYKPLGPTATTNYPAVFDPALKQFSQAFRHGEPSFTDEATAARWRTARLRILEHLLQMVAQSRWRENLILRGSLLMKQWFGDAAREPGDVDWLVQPATKRLGDAWTSELFAGLTRPARECFVGHAVVRITDVRVDDIWTYDRAPGRRIVYYWEIEGTSPGYVQMDIVFGEAMWSPPVPTAIATLSGANPTFWAATQEQALAWKLMWLDTDIWPQGKDLYDAVLLAERVRLPADLMKVALADRSRRSGNRPPFADFPLAWEIGDWATFQEEYPGVQGPAALWQARLTHALRLSFEAM